MGEVERLREAVKVAQDALTTIWNRFDTKGVASDTLHCIKCILNPLPATEEVEVHVYSVYNEDYTLCYSCSTDKAALCAPAGVETVTVDFVQKVQRPVPPKVEHSVSGEVQWKHDSIAKVTYPVGKDVNFDWDELIGKTGTMSFTWAE